MELPNLNRIVEAHIPLSPGNASSYFNQLRQDLLPYIRKLQTEGHLRWFSFLLHPANQISGRDPKDNRPVIHLRFEPATELDIQAFIRLLPTHFLCPQHIKLSEISGGLDESILRNHDWSHAWRIVGESSEWILCLLEGHVGEPPLKQITQLFHYITNPLLLGHKCECAGFRF
jgi:hypothetical protein